MKLITHTLTNYVSYSKPYPFETVYSQIISIYQAINESNSPPLYHHKQPYLTPHHAPGTAMLGQSPVTTRGNVRAVSCIYQGQSRSLVYGSPVQGSSCSVALTLTPILTSHPNPNPNLHKGSNFSEPARTKCRGFRCYPDPRYPLLIKEAVLCAHRPAYSEYKVCHDLACLNASS